MTCVEIGLRHASQQHKKHSDLFSRFVMNNFPLNSIDFLYVRIIHIRCTSKIRKIAH